MHPFMNLVSARSSSWQTAHAGVGGVFDEPPSFMKFHFLAVYEIPRAICQCSKLLALFQQEVEAHTVYQELFQKLAKRPTLHAKHSKKDGNFKKSPDFAHHARHKL